MNICLKRNHVGWVERSFAKPNKPKLQKQVLLSPRGAYFWLGLLGIAMKPLNPTYITAVKGLKNET